MISWNKGAIQITIPKRHKRRGNKGIFYSRRFFNNTNTYVVGIITEVNNELDEDKLHKIVDDETQKSDLSLGYDTDIISTTKKLIYEHLKEKPIEDIKTNYIHKLLSHLPEMVSKAGEKPTRAVLEKVKSIEDYLEIYEATKRGNGVLLLAPSYLDTLKGIRNSILNNDVSRVYSDSKVQVYASTK
ncbi:hypothetical protein CL615_02500 [archaeon]|jgi:hypothetical protein|nr:hypothetical protein [archaeon]MDP6547746.1 hypothetical protein [Candidatus Woesearchaeota archaeon]|tara:strand:- start:40910 stop:41467 length:558 start_codon:yes stop_codon:yes gene_type:complete